MRRLVTLKTGGMSNGMAIVYPNEWQAVYLLQLKVKGGGIGQAASVRAAARFTLSI